jgi:Cu/Ag efflux pump CusA
LSIASQAELARTAWLATHPNREVIVCLGSFGPQLVLRAATERLVPIMMTVLTTGFALIPLLVAGSIPGQEIEHPMAVVFFGGLVTATLLNLFVVPSLYLRFAKSRRLQLQVT